MEPDSELPPEENREPENGDPSLLTVTVFGGIIASLCCLLIPLVASVGTGGSAFDDAAFAGLKPYLIGAGWLIALGAVMYLVIRRLREPK